jgi:SAM-dependent methyltransferase
MPSSDTPSCSLCGAASTTITRFQPSVTSGSTVLSAGSRLCSCPSCGHLFTSVDLDLRAYYEQEYDAALTDDGFDEVVATPGGKLVYRTDLDYQMLRQAMGGLIDPGARIFEYGCGRGRILSRLKADGVRELFACDLSEKYRAPVSDIIGRGHLFLGERPDPKDIGTFDLACSFFALEHDEKAREALRYLRSLLSPHGRLYLAVPSYAQNLGDLACADHVNHFSVSTLRAVLAAEGFSVDGVDSTSAIGTLAVAAHASTGSFSDKLRVDPDDTAVAEMHGARFAGYIAAVEERIGRVDTGHPVFLYGAGFYASLVAMYLAKQGVCPAGVFDANPRKQGRSKFGTTVAAPEAILASHRDATLILCLNRAVAEPVRELMTPSFARVVVL